MLGELRAEVGTETPEGFRWVKIFQGVGTILERSAGAVLLQSAAAIELAKRINRHE